MTNTNLLYFDTDIEVLLGDRVSFKKLFKTVQGEVVYIPFQSTTNAAFGKDTWAIQLDDEPNDVRSMIFVPSQEPYALKKIKFISRGEGKKAVSSEEDIS